MVAGLAALGIVVGGGMGWFAYEGQQARIALESRPVLRDHHVGEVYRRRPVGDHGNRQDRHVRARHDAVVRFVPGPILRGRGSAARRCHHLSLRPPQRRRVITGIEFGTGNGAAGQSTGGGQ